MLIFSKSIFNKLNRKTLAIYGTPIIIGIIIGLFIWQDNLSPILESKQRIEQYRDNIQKYQQKISQLEKEINDNKKELTNFKNILKGQDAYIIISYIQNEIEKIPEISVRSFRIAKTIDKGLYQIGTVNLVLDGDIKGLVKFLQESQNCQYPLRIKRLSVSYRRIANRDRLNIVLEIQGLFLKG